MLIGILITARMGSTRLLNKHFRDIAGRPAVRWLIDRITIEFDGELAAGNASLYIATGNANSNGCFSEIAHGTNTKVFFGDDDNVPLRHLQAAKKHGFEAILSVDGDDIFCAPEAMRAVYDALADGKSLVKTSGLSLGMNAWGYSTSTLAKALESTSSTLLETGWGRIFGGITAHHIEFSCPDAECVRATLDYPEDLMFFDKCARLIPGWSGLPVAELMRAVVMRNLHQLNASVTEKYWDNFKTNVDNEQKKSQDR